MTPAVGHDLARLTAQFGWIPSRDSSPACKMASRGTFLDEPPADRSRRFRPYQAVADETRFPDA